MTSKEQAIANLRHAYMQMLRPGWDDNKVASIAKGLIGPAIAALEKPDVLSTSSRIRITKDESQYCDKTYPAGISVLLVTWDDWVESGHKLPTVLGPLDQLNPQDPLALLPYIFPDGTLRLLMGCDFDD
jgi:hypothetical protein